MRPFLIVLILVFSSCQEIDQPSECDLLYLEYKQLRKDFDDYLNEWIRLDRYELKHSDVKEWIELDPEQRYQKMIAFMDEHAWCLDFR